MRHLFLPILLLTTWLSQTAWAQTDLSYFFANHVGDNNSQNECYGMNIDAQGNILSVGYFRDSVDFDPGPGSLMLTAEGNRDGYVQKLDSAGHLIWAFKIGAAGGSNGVDEVADVVTDAAGNLYLTGSFIGAVDFDPGLGSFPLTSGAARDVFVAKYDPAGNFLWAKRMGGSEQDLGLAIDLDPSGNVLVSGRFSGTVDFDPGPGSTTLSGGLGPPDIFILKLTNSGDFQWVRQIGSPNTGTRVYDVACDPAGDVVLVGAVQGSVDLDPGPGTYVLASTSGYNGYVLKLDAGGNFVWARYSADSDSKSENFQVALDALGQIYVAGEFAGTADIDPGLNTTQSLTAVDAVDGIVQKLTANGDWLWTRVISGQNNQWPRAIDVDADGFVYVAGSFSGETDIDPGPGVQTLSTPASSFDWFTQKLDSSGNLIWGYPLASSNSALAKAIELGPNQEIVMAGNFGADLNVAPDSVVMLTTSSIMDPVVISWRQGLCSNLAVLLDTVADVSCAAPGIAVGRAQGGQPPYQYSWNTNPATQDSTLQTLSAGWYTLTATDSKGCGNTATVYLDGPEEQEGFDLQVNMITGDLRPGVQASLHLEAFNAGCAPVSGDLTLILDPAVQYDSAAPAPDLISGDTLIWSFSGLSFDSGALTPHLFITPDTTVTLGQLLCFPTRIDPLANDLDTSNNLRTYCYEAVNSFDPNDKQVFPRGQCAEGYIAPDQRLTYTVRFQNTGNAEAIDIAILDTLSPHLDLGSFEFLGTSHPGPLVERLEDRILRFRWEGINLPDSASDPEGSQGYMVFALAPKSGLSSGIEITNRVGIYFDFNDPIITNTVRNTLADPVPEVVTELDIEACAPYTYGAYTYGRSGVYEQRFRLPDGCDSVVALSLSLTEVSTTVSTAGGTLTAQEPDASYQWLDCANGLAPISGAEGQTFAPIQSGDYAVVITTLGCNDTSACYTMATTSLSQSLAQALRVYPNPSGGQVTLALGQRYRWVELTLLDATGRSVLARRYQATEQIALDLPAPAGLYLLRIQADNQQATLPLRRQ